MAVPLYEKGSSTEPSLMWNLDLYARLDLADARAIMGPVSWYAPELAMKQEHSPEWEGLRVNHLESRTAAFFLCGDGGGDELDETEGQGAGRRAASQEELGEKAS